MFISGASLHAKPASMPASFAIRCPPEVEQVLSHYGEDCRPRQIDDLGSAGGFSGARFWRLETRRGLLCLRRWPVEHPDSAGLETIHALLWHIREQGFSLAPLPIRTRDGESFVREVGHLWELTNWLPGRADYFPERKPQKISAALTALAEFHRACARFAHSPHGPREERHHAERDVYNRQSTSPSLNSRLEYVEHLRNGGLAAVERAVRESTDEILHDWRELAFLSRQLFDLFRRAESRVRDRLAAAANLEVPLQMTLGDIRHDHVLFDDDRVTGLIDFGSVRIDSVAGDIARLLGSMADDDEAAWQQGIAAYQTVRPLSPTELALIPAFDQSATLLSGMNWVNWVFVAKRAFDDRAAVTRRVAETIARLEHLSR